MFRLTKINDEVVNPIKTKNNFDKKNLLSYDIIPLLHPNIFICARKKSGKTCTIFKILQKTANKNTKVIVFAPTHEYDESYTVIKNWLDKKGIENQFYYSTIAPESRVNLLEEFLNLMIEKRKEEKEKEGQELDEKPIELMTKEEIYELLEYNDNDDELSVKIKKKKPKKITSDYVIILDDLGEEELKNNALSNLLKKNRHYKITFIISSQYPNDIKPVSRKNLDLLLLFGGHDAGKLEELYKNIQMPVSFEDFLELYKTATEEKYNFLYSNVPDGEFRKNFNEKFHID